MTKRMGAESHSRWRKGSCTMFQDICYFLHCAAGWFVRQHLEPRADSSVKSIEYDSRRSANQTTAYQAGGFQSSAPQRLLFGGSSAASRSPCEQPQGEPWWQLLMHIFSWACPCSCLLSADGGLLVARKVGPLSSARPRESHLSGVSFGGWQGLAYRPPPARRSLGQARRS